MYKEIQLKTFVSYCHQDEPWFDRFRIHVAPLVMNGIISIWSDQEIMAGQPLDSEIASNMSSAELFVLLLSPAYFASDYCMNVELAHAISRHQSKEVKIVPIIVESCKWDAIPKLRELKIIPKDAKPISEWSDQNAAFVGVVNEIENLVQSELGKKNIKILATRTTSGILDDQSGLDTKQIVRTNMQTSDIIEQLNQGTKSFRAVRIENFELKNYDLQEIDFCKANLRFAKLEGTNLVEANFSKANLESADLSLTNMSRANLSAANLAKVNLVGSNLISANLWNCHMTGAQLENASLEGANMVKAFLNGANLQNSKLEFAIMLQAELNGANLESVVLDGASLVSAELENANLMMASLNCTNLAGATMRGAKLMGTDLRFANFFGADLEGVSFQGADLSYANLMQTNLTNANFEGAIQKGVLR